MRRSPRVDEAVRLVRVEGVSKAAAARRCGVDPSAVWKRLNPEATRESVRIDNARRNDAKRKWEREHDRPSCPECAQPMGIGAHRRGCVSCMDCRLAEAERKRRQIIDGYRQGLAAWQIADATGIPENTVKTEACRLRRAGVDVPYAPVGRPSHRQVAS